MVSIKNVVYKKKKLKFEPMRDGRGQMTPLMTIRFKYVLESSWSLEAVISHYFGNRPCCHVDMGIISLKN